MKFRYKVLFAIGAVAVATAASSPSQFGIVSATWQEREALSMCQQSNSTFVRFLASERDDCYSRFRTAVDEHTGLWSRHNRGPQQLADARRS